MVVIIGQTASGKSALAMTLAQNYNGEIICADSRTIYKGMDIGTAKPTKADRAKVNHYGLDLILPSETYSAAEFKRYATAKVNDINSRNKLPIVVGGTGLYIDGFLYDYEFGDKTSQQFRQELDAMSMKEIRRLAEELKITADDINFANRRHLQRAVERGGMIKSARNLPSNILLIGTQISKELLFERIAARVEHMFEQGFQDEVIKLVEIYGSDAPGLLAPGYKEAAEYLNGRPSQEDVKKEIIKSHMRLSKRQKTWFKRNHDIQWVSNEKKAGMLIKTFLTNFATIEQ